jgi:ankyrin repeat protein
MPIDKKLQELFFRYQEMFSDYSDMEITDVNQRGDGEDSLLLLAASHCGSEDVVLLLKNGADVNAKGDLGLTPLHLAASKGRLDIIKILLQYGAKLNIENDFGECAVDWARNNNQDEVVKYWGRAAKPGRAGRDLR